MSAESVAEESKAEEPAEKMELNDKPAAEEAVGVVDLPVQELPAREHRPPPWFGEYGSRLYHLFYYMTQKTEAVLREGGVVMNVLSNRVVVLKSISGVIST